MSSVLDGLRGVVNAEILERTEAVSRALTALEIPHALVGGLAVGVHGHPRLTRDVDFLVGMEAFERTTPFLVYRAELAEVARVGFSDLLAVPDGYPCLEAEVSLNEGVPVISLPALVLMKLIAYRPQDRADVAALLSRDDARISRASDYLGEHAPAMLARLGEVLGALQ